MIETSIKDVGDDVFICYGSGMILCIRLFMFLYSELYCPFIQPGIAYSMPLYALHDFETPNLSLFILYCFDLFQKHKHS